MNLEDIMQCIQEIRENNVTLIGGWQVSAFNMGKEHTGLALTRDSGAWSVQLGPWYFDIWKNSN